MQRSLARDIPQLVGETVEIKGFVSSIRDHGHITFVDIRDRSGLVQVVGNKAQLRALKPESVVAVVGMVNKRTAETVNDKLETGQVEIELHELTVLSIAETLPFPIDTDGLSIDEALRLRYRYLDLRRARLNQTIKRRSEFVQRVRKFLFEQDFVEIETPMLTQSTQEGSRDFLVPSRLNRGTFFALPQSPQQYKQLLMTAGFERYFQLARCIRDEDLRADRGFEHTQIDLEMSYVNREEVMALDEAMIITVMEAMGAKLTQKPFPVLTYQEAMQRFGKDKFDLRSEEEKAQGMLAFAWVVDFPFFKQVDKSDAAEVADSKSGWTFTHNPFSMPKEEHLEWHLNGEHVGEILTTQYDLVCNGYEVGGGSIRAHRPEILKATYQIMGYSEAEIEARAGHMLKAFSFGTPPHGGLAHGVDRLLMILQNIEFLREVVAFPQTAKGTTAVMNAPSKVSDEQLADLGIKVVNDEREGSVYERILEQLTLHGVEYTHYVHEPVKTSQDAATVRGEALHMGAKALILRDHKKNHFLYVLPGDKQVDIKALKAYLNVSKVEFAKADWVLEHTGLEFGSIPPFGNLMGLQTYVDKALDQEEIIFNAGKLDRSIKMKYADYLQIVEPIVVEI